MSAHGHVERHAHIDAHLVLVIGGGYLTAAAGADALGPMTLVYNPPGVTHRDRFVTAAGRFACLSIDAQTIDLFNDDFALPEKPTLVPDPCAAIEFFRRAAGEDSDLEEFSMVALAGAGARRPSPERAAPRWLKKAIGAIEDRIPGPVSVTQIASEAGVHPVHLTRVFRRFTGVTPSHYAQDARLRYAYALMRRRDLTLAEIAQAAGYADQSHLARAFRRRTRTGADAFRKGRPSVS